MISANLRALYPAYAQIFMQRKTISRYCSLNLGGFFQLDHFTAWPFGGKEGMINITDLKSTKKGSADFNPAYLCCVNLKD